jgi:hypothetical protein
MSASDDLTEKLVGTMRILADESQWPVKLPILEHLIRTVITDWVDSVDSKMTELIQDWESKFEEDDSTLYTLGIRRAQDIFHEDND